MPRHVKQLRLKRLNNPCGIAFKKTNDIGMETLIDSSIYELPLRMLDPIFAALPGG